MKKILLAVAVALISSLCLILNLSSVHASATDNDSIVVSVRKITSAEAAEYNSSSKIRNKGTANLVGGDYIVTLVVNNNTGFAGIGYRIRYNQSYSAPVLNAGKPVYIPGDMISDIMCNVTYNYEDYSHCVGIGATSSDDVMATGVVFSFFLRKTISGNLTAAQEANLITEHEA